MRISEIITRRSDAFAVAIILVTMVTLNWDALSGRTHYLQPYGSYAGLAP